MYYFLLNCFKKMFNKLINFIYFFCVINDGIVSVVCWNFINIFYNFLENSFIFVSIMLSR